MLENVLAKSARRYVFILKGDLILALLAFWYSEITFFVNTGTGSPALLACRVKDPGFFIDF